MERAYLHMKKTQSGYAGSPREMVEELMEGIGREKVLGVVMNWFDLRSSSYYGYGK